MAGYAKPRQPYAGMGSRYLPATSPATPPRAPFSFASPPGVMGANIRAPGGYPALGGGRAGGRAAQPYTIQAYVKSLGYPSVAAYLHALGLDVPAYTPETDAQIQAKSKAYADSIINPQLDRLNSDYAGRTKLGSQAIQSLTTMLAGLAGQYAPASKATYDEAISSDKALAGALADRLTSSGQSSGAELGAKLAQAGQDTSGAGQIADVGRFAGNAGFAKDTAALEALTANSAAAQTFGNQLPFIEGLTGAQNGRDFQMQLQQALAQDTRAITDQAPDLLRGYAQDLYSRDQNSQARHDTAAGNRAQAQINLTSDYVNQRNTRQANAENTRRYNESIREHQQQVARQNRLDKQAAQTTAYNKKQQRLSDRQTLLHNFEARTGYQGTLTSTGVTYKVVNGQRVLTPGEAAQRRSEAERKREFNVSAKAAGIKTETQAATDQAKLNQAAQKETDRNTEALKRIDAEITSTNARIAHNKAIEQNSAASIDQRRQAAQARAADEKRRAALTKSQQAETARHHRATERTTATKPNPEPIRVGPGQWKTANGRTLSPKGSAYWEKKFQDGFTDGKGHRQPGKRPKGGGSSSGGSSSGGFDPTSSNYGAKH